MASNPGSGMRRFDRAPVARPTSLKTEKQAATTRGIVLAVCVGLGVFLAPCVLAALAVPIYRHNPMAAKVILLGIWWIALVLAMLCSFWVLFVAFSEDVVCGLLYLFLPGYFIYYYITRWREIWEIVVVMLACMWIYGTITPVCMAYGAQPLAIYEGKTQLPKTEADEAFATRDERAKEWAQREAEAKARAAQQAAEEAEARKPGGRLSPVALPPAALFEAMPASAAAWTVEGGVAAHLGPEVAVGGLRMRPPAALLIKPPREGLPPDQAMVDWDGRDSKEAYGAGRARLTLRVMPKTDAQINQHRPWLVERDKEIPAEHQGLLAHTVDQATTERFAHSNGLTWVLFDAVDRSSTTRSLSVTFAYTAVGNQWVSARAAAGHSSDDALAAMLAAIASVRVAKDDEPAPDLYPLETLMRMGRANDVWAQDRLKRERSAIEEKLLGDLRDRKPETRLRAVQLLAEIGTENSHSLLQAAHYDPDPAVAQAALRAMQKLAPDKLDRFATAVALLRSSDVSLVREGLASLRQVTPDDRRDKVLPALWALVERDPREARQHYFDYTQLRPEALSLAAAWAGKDAVPRLIALIGPVDRPYFNDGLQKHAIVLLGRTRDERALPVLVALTEHNERLVVPALIEYGPAAEKEVLKLLRGDGRGKMAAIEVLGQIGGRASLPTLLAISESRYDSRYQAEALAAHRAILERLKEQRETTTRPH